MGQGTAFDGEMRGTRALWPWMVLILLTLPAFWHVAHYDTELDPEFPKVVRPTFSLMPAASYRLAEPGDTIDRVGIYFSCAGIVFCAIGMIAGRGRGLWPAGLALMLCCFWEAANPGPTLDGWHGLGWRAGFDPASPLILRLALAAGALALASIIAVTLWANRPSLRGTWSRAARDGSRGLWIVGLLLIVGRYGEIPGVEPRGYWPRWSLAWGLVAIDLCLLRLLPKVTFRKAIWLTPVVLGCWLLCVLSGIWLTWYHRPLSRLRPVIDDRIYISAMPTRRGLEVAYPRHPFRTIINLFPEDLLARSPYYDEERAFAEEHGIRYVLSPADTSLEASTAFLDETLRLAQDPSAWPILVHCHGNMDRTPAWMGIYRFLIEGRPLVEIMQEIEQHRGSRPKSSVTILYNRVLAQRAPERYAADPTAATLRESAAGVVDPAWARAANPEAAASVSSKLDSPNREIRSPSRRR
jgi:hypothetical protein